MFPSILIEHLSKSLGRQTILRDVNLQVNRGEVLGLLGPNGAGKSTLMKILTGIWSADDGQVEVCGVDVRLSPHEVTHHVGYLPENNPLYDDLYVREYLIFMKRLSEPSSVTVDDVIRLTGLAPEAHKRIGQLSKGYRQRVGLAQALLGDPQLLILDEPTNGLDPNQLNEIRGLIRTLSQDRTIILSTHVLQEVREMCTRVVVLADHTIQADCPMTADLDLETLFRHATH